MDYFFKLNDFRFHIFNPCIWISECKEKNRFVFQSRTKQIFVQAWATKLYASWNKKQQTFVQAPTTKALCKFK